MYSLRIKESRHELLPACRYALTRDSAPEAVYYGKETDLFSESRTDGEILPHALGYDGAETERVLRTVSDRMAKALDSAARSERDIVGEACGYAVGVKLWGERAADDWGCRDARAVLEAEHSVARELHRFYGIMRFRKTDNGSWYAVCEPDFDICDLLIPFFMARMPGERFSIRDGRRGTLHSHDKQSGDPYIPDRPSKAQEPAAVGETPCEYANEQTEALWRAFFKAHENPQKANPRCQDNHLPKRYRKYMNEFG